ncbi:ADP-ribosylation factor GTPase-activating protein AGD3 [Linum perenne]
MGRNLNESDVGFDLVGGVQGAVSKRRLSPRLRDILKQKGPDNGDKVATRFYRQLNYFHSQRVQRMNNVNEDAKCVDIGDTVDLEDNSQVKWTDYDSFVTDTDIETTRRSNYLDFVQRLNTKEKLHPEVKLGSLPGIVAGHRFSSRAEMMQNGCTPYLAVAVVLSCTSRCDVDCKHEVVYIHQGGTKLSCNKQQVENQDMLDASLALKTSIERERQPTLSTKLPGYVLNYSVFSSYVKMLSVDRYFKYSKSIEVATGVIIPPPASGCKCNGNCTNPKTCSCARFNGFDFPYVNQDGGRLVEAKDIVYECGPGCCCGSKCTNRVSQRGLKYQLEVYRTKNKGWAVRSWDSIPAGAPVCEYTGLLRRSAELDSVCDNDYIFDIDCLHTMHGIGGREKRETCLSETSSTPGKVDATLPESESEFCIDAGSCGNVTRFINHSCEPNLFVQCILSSHHDLRLARIVLFAAEDIPPMDELTYDYGYRLGSVTDGDDFIPGGQCRVIERKILKVLQRIEGLGEGYDGDIAFASALESFGGGHNDPISVAFGGPVMTKFTIALREIGTYKEVLRSQEARKCFDKASLIYDQELHNARSSFEQSRFNLVTTLSNVEAKKRFEFLEAVSGTMDAHLRYFKQVLTYAQQSRERSNYEQAALNEKMQEYKRQVDRESRLSSNGSNGSPNGDGLHAIGRSSHKMIEAVMQSAARGKVQTIRQGYLSKRSSNLRGDWKRRFFVLDSRGMLYYYRKQCSKPSSSGSQLNGQRNSSELGSGLLSRWLSSHHHGGVHDEKSVAHHTVNLLTSTIKVDADQSDLRFCFRIISPTKNYTLQAESALDQMDWIEKITGVIAALLSSQAPDRCFPASPIGSGHHRSASESSSYESTDFDHPVVDEYPCERSHSGAQFERQMRSSQQQRICVEKPIDLLRRVCGNDRCADCGSPEPDWASLNLGILVCIECSGVHRNLGVHISKVRSLTLDVKVWEPSVISLFQSLGNAFSNSVWEELLQSRSCFQADVISSGSYKSAKPQLLFLGKPNPADSISVKEKFIHAKYAEKLFIRKPRENQCPQSVAQQMWEGVRANDKKALYRLIVNHEVDVNIVYDQATISPSLTLAKAMLLQEQKGVGNSMDRSSSGSNCMNLVGTNNEGEMLNDQDGCTLLHLACETADIGMLELLLQYGANVNSRDSRGRTPLHWCTTRGRASFAKLLLSRGANRGAVSGEGKTSLEVGVDCNVVENEILGMLSDSNG